MTHKLSLIVAVADNNVIGKDNKMPWHIFEDFELVDYEANPSIKAPIAV